MKLSIANIFLQTVFSGMVEGKMRGYHSLSRYILQFFLAHFLTCLISLSGSLAFLGKIYLKV